MRRKQSKKKDKENAEVKENKVSSKRQTHTLRFFVSVIDEATIMSNVNFIHQNEKLGFARSLDRMQEEMKEDMLRIKKEDIHISEELLRAATQELSNCSIKEQEEKRKRELRKPRNKRFM